MIQWVQPVIFYVFAAITVLCALMVISSRNPVLGALYLVTAFVSSAVIWMLLDAEFLALALLFVYVGAVMTLFLFVVMMLNIELEPLKQAFSRYTPVGLIISLAILALMLFLIFAQKGFHAVAIPAAAGASFSNVLQLGKVLYTTYALPFEMAAVVLLAAIIAAIALAMPLRSQRKRQDPGEQIQVKARDRIRLVD